MTTEFPKPTAPVAAGWILLIVSWLFYLLPIPIVSALLGWSLSIAAFVVAIVVIAKGRVGAGVAQLLVNIVLTPLIYLFGTALLVGVAVSLFTDASSEKSPSSDPATTARASEGARRASGRPERRVAYPRGCTVRAEPKGSATKVSFAAAGKRYPVLQRKGVWRRIQLDDATEGWAACAAGGRPASRPTADAEQAEAE